MVTPLMGKWVTQKARHQRRNVSMPAAPSAGGQTSSGEASWPLDETAGMEAYGLLPCAEESSDMGASKNPLFLSSTNRFSCNSDWIFFPESFINHCEKFVLFATCWGNRRVDCNHKTLRLEPELNTKKTNEVTLQRGPGLNNSIIALYIFPKAQTLEYSSRIIEFCVVNKSYL